MKRLGCLIGLLAVGVLINIGVSIATAVWGEVHTSHQSDSIALEWAMKVPVGWPNPSTSIKAKGTGIDLHVLEHETKRLSIIRTGWPLRSLQAVHLQDGMPPRRGHTIGFELTGRRLHVAAESRTPSTTVDSEFGTTPVWMAFRANRMVQRVVPVQPVWPCFLVNSAFYAVLSVFVQRAFVIARGSIRKRRGRCQRCGYSLHGLTNGVCPECGAANTPPASRPSAGRTPPATPIHPAG